MKSEMKTFDLELSALIPASPIEAFDGWLDPQCPGTPWKMAAKLVLDPKVDGLFYWLFINEGRRGKASLMGQANSPLSTVPQRFNTHGCRCIRAALNRWSP